MDNLYISNISYPQAHQGVYMLAYDMLVNTYAMTWVKYLLYLSLYCLHWFTYVLGTHVRTIERRRYKLGMILA